MTISDGEKRTVEQTKAPKTTRKRLDLDEYVPYQLALLSHTLGALLQHSYEEYGLGVTEWRVLAVVADRSEMTAVDIARRSGLNQVGVHRAVKVLLDREMLYRKTDTIDRRRKFLSLTESGFAVYERVVPDALRLQQELLGILGDDERRIFCAALVNLCRLFGLGSASSPPSDASAPTHCAATIS